MTSAKIALGLVGLCIVAALDTALFPQRWVIDLAIVVIAIPIGGYLVSIADETDNDREVRERLRQRQRESSPRKRL